MFLKELICNFQMLPTKYMSIYTLEKRVPYKVTEIRECSGQLLLQLFNYKYPTQLFETLLLHPGFADAFRKAVQCIRFLNGNEVNIHLKIYGWSPAGDPIIRISRRKFVRYLISEVPKQFPVCKLQRYISNFIGEPLGDLS
jgi:hypothetical protein